MFYNITRKPNSWAKYPARLYKEILSQNVRNSIVGFAINNYSQRFTVKNHYNHAYLASVLDDLPLKYQSPLLVMLLLCFHQEIKVTALTVTR